MAERGRIVASARRRKRGWPVLALVAWTVVLPAVVLRAAPAAAHALDPVLFQLTERTDGFVDVTWKAPNARVPGLALVPVFPPECRRVEGDVSVPADGDGSLESVLQVQQSEADEQDASIARWTVQCDGGLVGRTIGIDGLESTDALVRIQLRSGSVDRRVLGADRSRVTVQAEPTRLDVFADYARLGVLHILTGVDHLVFVFGLLLLVSAGRALLATVTAFTLGHSVTLALAALQIINVAQAPVEVVIAATIYVLAVELARPPKSKATMLRHRPWAMAFVFGLLHGLGFAGALRETGLPASEIPLALLSFNLGIEAGQLLFVASVLALGALAAGPIDRLPQRLRLAPVYAMGTLAVYWIFQRAALLL